MAEMSALCRHVEVHFARLCYAPFLVVAVKHTRGPSTRENVDRAHACLRNGACRLLLDVLLGWCLWAMAWCWLQRLFEGADDIEAAVLQPAWEVYSRAITRTQHVLRAYVEGAPEGVKLNMPLTAALGKLLLTFTDAYDSSVRALARMAVWVVGGVHYCSGVGTGYHLLVAVAAGLAFLGGVSCVCAALLDIWMLATAPVDLLYRAFLYCNKTCFCMLSSLWMLLRGRKHNVLRGRIDPIRVDRGAGDGFSVFQLILGTLIFVGTLGLWPTALMYFLLIAVLWVAKQSVAWLLRRSLRWLRRWHAFSALMGVVRGADPLGPTCPRLHTTATGAVVLSASPDRGPAYQRWLASTRLRSRTGVGQVGLPSAAMCWRLLKWCCRAADAQDDGDGDELRAFLAGEILSRFGACSRGGSARD